MEGPLERRRGAVLFGASPVTEHRGGSPGRTAPKDANVRELFGALGCEQCDGEESSGSGGAGRRKQSSSSERRRGRKLVPMLAGSMNARKERRDARKSAETVGPGELTDSRSREVILAAPRRFFGSVEEERGSCRDFTRSPRSGSRRHMGVLRDIRRRRSNRGGQALSQTEDVGSNSKSELRA